MDLITKILAFLDTRMTRPEVFGWFHFMWLGIIVVATVLLCKFLDPKKEKNVRAMLLVISVTCLVLELYKQINYTFQVVDGVIVPDYQWYAFPLQFCNIPAFAGLLAGILGKGKVYDALCAFLGTFSLFAGICVMIYPNDVFTTPIGINIETMICHGAMVVQGIYLLASGYVKSDFRTVRRGTYVFSSVLVLAIALNEIAHYTDFTNGETFNLFYVSRHEDPSLPVYSIVQQYVPYPFCLIIYIFIFALAAFLITMISKGLLALHSKRKNKKAA